VTPIHFPVPPVRKVVMFSGSAEQAFERFTSGIGSWWPLATHSLGREAQALTVGFERIETGARLIERWRDGQQRIWGTLVDVDPPTRVSFTWHVGREADSAQLIELTFEPIKEGLTQVILVHSGWERLGAAGAEARESYNDGWNGVLAQFVRTAVTSAALSDP
jgi:uncharacterized protein YndB with AHSA1/START domain